MNFRQDIPPILEVSCKPARVPRSHDGPVSFMQSATSAAILFGESGVCVSAQDGMVVVTCVAGDLRLHPDLADRIGQMAVRVREGVDIGREDTV
jgi:hypothetical protein